MLFNSFQFAIFFFTFLALFFATPRAGRPVLLLIASYIFYAGWRPSFLILLLFTTLVDYGAARLIDSTENRTTRLVGLTASLVVNLGLLGTFKYLDFLLSSVVGTAGFFGVELPPVALNLILPVGISFYTFQSVGYIIDVYKRRFPAERSLLFYAIYVAFFPQLVAGPIERASHMIAQYKAQRPTSPERIATGFWLIGWGLFKKMCVADLVSPFVNGVYGDPAAFNGSFTLLATVFFAIQIYCDFSGYSDIAIGVARIMGFDLMINFRQPYFAPPQPDRVLAAMAHLAVDLVPRLSLRPARRQPHEHAALGPQHARRLRGERPLARCQLDLPGLGAAARDGSRRRGPARATRPCRNRDGGGPARVAPRTCPRDHLHAGGSAGRMGLLSREEHRGRVPHPGLVGEPRAALLRDVQAA